MWHSKKAVEVMKEITIRVENIIDGCAESFPFEIIEVLKRKEALNNGNICKSR
ncbi:MAG TPA: hypothetical protein H9858_05760 [Candidatus Blautia stercoravium]|nr:hypothetical protein [Candidatus Blautia stercoravium]